MADYTGVSLPPVIFTAVPAGSMAGISLPVLPFPPTAYYLTAPGATTRPTTGQLYPRGVK